MGSQRGLLWWVPVGLELTPAVWALRSPPCRPALTRSLYTGVSVHVCNEQRYGYLNVPVQSHQGLEDERVNFIHLILEALGEAASGVVLPPHHSPPLPQAPSPWPQTWLGRSRSWSQLSLYIIP